MRTETRKVFVLERGDGSKGILKIIRGKTTIRAKTNGGEKVFLVFSR